jgi:hypothetical protein
VDEVNIAAIGWALLGALITLTLVLLWLVAFAWNIIGAHVVSVIADAGRRAVDERLGKKRGGGQVVKLQRAPVREESRKP